MLALSSFTFTFTNGNGRALGEQPVETGVVDQLQTEIERIFYVYLNAFESEECIARAMCESGVYAKSYKNKDFYMRLVRIEWYLVYSKCSPIIKTHLESHYMSMKIRILVLLLETLC